MKWLAAAQIFLRGGSVGDFVEKTYLELAIVRPRSIDYIFMEAVIECVDIALGKTANGRIDHEARQKEKDAILLQSETLGMGLDFVIHHMLEVSVDTTTLDKNDAQLWRQQIDSELRNRRKKPPPTPRV